MQERKDVAAPSLGFQNKESGILFPQLFCSSVRIFFLVIEKTFLKLRLKAENLQSGIKMPMASENIVRLIERAQTYHQ